jgi:hypothetical protein
MHPIFKGGRLPYYLLAWAPVATGLTLLLMPQAHLRSYEAAVVAAPMCLVYAFVCLSSWYTCRALPVRHEPLTRILSTHLLSATVLSAIWTALTWGLMRSAFTGKPIDVAMPSVFAIGIILYLLAVALSYVFLSVEASRLSEAREAEARVLAGEAELRAIKAQINPHFLFNSLHSISALTSIDATKAREMCILLSEFLRNTLGFSDRREVSLEEELSLARSYLAIEKIRFGARLQTEEEIEPGCLPIPVPPLLLQPLVENAVIHGIAHIVDTGFIRITAAEREGELAITVKNSFDPEAPAKRRGGFGVASVRKRLQARYGVRASLDAGAENGAYHVELRLPLEDLDQ